MKNWLLHRRIIFLLITVCGACCNPQASSAAMQAISMPRYSVIVAAGDPSGNPPQLKLERDHQVVFQMPIVAGLASSSSEERLSAITYTLRKSGEETYELNVSARSSLWTDRRFQWRFFPDHIEFQQFATGSGKLGRCYFLSN